MIYHSKENKFEFEPWKQEEIQKYRTEIKILEKYNNWLNLRKVRNTRNTKNMDILAKIESIETDILKLESNPIKCQSTIDFKKKHIALLEDKVLKGFNYDKIGR